MVALCDTLYLSMTAWTMKTVSQCFRAAELKMWNDNCRERERHFTLSRDHTRHYIVRSKKNRTDEMLTI